MRGGRDIAHFVPLLRLFITTCEHAVISLRYAEPFCFAKSGSKITSILRQAKRPLMGSHCLAERAGFEPAVRCRTTVFKTVTFNHSVTSPEATAHHIKFYLLFLEVDGQLPLPTR